MYEVVGLKDGEEEVLDTGIEGRRIAQDTVDEYKLTYGNQYQQIWFRVKKGGILTCPKTEMKSV